ncbi:MAG: ABC transporter ATP-binding protein [Pseudochelatococcus sp.]|jgi:branched-chain amino acid transport system ATP-binding protein|uniref:ABC transporter ATP-binding protein n=1 Tax=Pseudochelatococcus sp. TaxID=2020869 RepID=UPI003D8D524A
MTGASVTPASATPALATRGLSRTWGAFKANSDIDMELPEGARHALIGPNGAGKTTFINLLTGVVPPTSGEVFLGGEAITHLSQEQRVRKGLARTFQINNLFPGLTVLESVVLAILERKQLTRHWFRPVARYREEIEEARSLAADLHLDDRLDEEVRTLPYGKQRLLEIVLALATRPKILLLDEPAAGIPAGESTEVFNVIAKLPADVTILFIEHDMDLVMRFADRITVLVGGRVLTEGTPQAITSDPRVREVYLGEADHG